MRFDYEYIRDKYDTNQMDRSILDGRYLVHQFDTMGFTPLHWAVKKEDQQMCRLLMRSKIIKMKKR